MTNELDPQTTGSQDPSVAVENLDQKLEDVSRAVQLLKTARLNHRMGPEGTPLRRFNQDATQNMEGTNNPAEPPHQP